MTQPHPIDSSGSEGRLARGCLGAVAAAVLLLAGAGGAWWWFDRRAEEAALAAQAARAEAEFAPVLERLDAAAAEPRYDIDQTMRAIHEIDRAMADARSVPEFLAAMEGQDYRGVAPEVLRARRELLEILQRLYAKQAEQAQQEEMWALSSETVLQLLTLVKTPGATDLAPVALDRAEAKRVLRELEERREARAEILSDIHAVEGELLDATLRWSEVYYRYVAEWDRLCVERDRAYLAVSSRQWSAAAESARAAIALAPEEQEAHLLLALAAIEGGPEARADLDVDAMLARQVERHPDGAAPALLLRGVLAAREGRDADARLHLQQAAAYYPRQSAKLASLVDPYRARSFLRKSREGLYVVELYSATMAGAGYFSPDLQLARGHFARGEVEEGREKVRDHFFRRRAQQEWAFLLEDIEFAEAFLGDDFRAIFPEEPWLDLVVERSLLPGRLNLAVKNRTRRTLHNATLLLCLQLTDMFPGDYVVLPAGPTLPAVNPQATTTFESVEIAIERLGVVKGRDDIVQVRAILVSDEAVTWVDTEAYKLAEVEAARKAEAAATPPGVRARLVQQVTDALRRQAALTTETGLGKDDVVITLPDELATLAPVFRLRVGDTVVSPSENELGDGVIALRFPDVFNFDDPDAARPDLGLVITGPGAELAVDWMPGQGVTYALRGVSGR